MAKYTIRYACGHGETTEQLYGPERERQRRIAWAEAHKVCPACYVAQRKAADAAADKIVFLEASADGRSVTARASGQIDANKDALQSLGFAWSRDYGGVLDALSVKEPPLALILRHTYTDTADLRAWIASLGADLSRLGYRIDSKINPLDVSMIKAAAAARTEADKARAEAVAAHPRPQRPEWYQAIRAKHADPRFNGKIYGTGRLSIYVGGQQYAISAQQAAELKDYLTALAAHTKAKQV